MNTKIIERVMLEIATPTGLTYFGDATICNDEAKDIINYINNLEQRVKKQQEVIDKIKYVLNNQINYREFVDIVNDIEDILKEK